MKRLALALVLVALVGSAVAAQDSNQDPKGLALSMWGPFTGGAYGYMDEYDHWILDTLTFSLRYSMLLGYKVMTLGSGSLYAAGTPYLLVTDTSYEYGTGLGLFYLGKPLFLGVDVALYASGYDGSDGSTYTWTPGDTGITNVYLGANATYHARTLFGREVVRRVYGALRLRLVNYPEGYMDYTGFGLVIGGSL